MGGGEKDEMGVMEMTKQKVLVVEDEKIMQESLRDWLTEDGFEVATAGDGEQALEIIGREEFGVVVLDLKLPGRDGVEVLKEARTKRPDLKAIIITAYPSVETAVEAMKFGAIDYVPKPFSPEILERLIEQALETATAEVRAEAAVEVAEPLAEGAELEEIITITPEAAPAHLERGKELFKAKEYARALKEFEAVKAVVPADIEARTWIRKAKMALTEEVAEGEAVEEVAKPKECLWMKMGMISYRICTRDYECTTCEFDQQMQEQMASGEETPEIAAAMERLKGLPGNQRLCRYVLRGEISHRLCARLYQCTVCEFAQTMQDEMERKQAKLAARREALRRKEERVQAKAQ